MKTSLIKIYLLLFLPAVFLANACNEPLQQLTDAEAISFAKEMETSIKKTDGEFLDNSIDRPAFIKKMKLPETSDAKNFGTGIFKKLQLGNKISNSLTDQDEFKFIKHYVKEGKHHAIFRLYGNKESTLNYHDYELIKVNNESRIADVYIYMSGEPLSETMGNLYKDLYDEARDRKKEASEMADIGRVRTLLQKGKNAEAKKLYDALPAYLKKNKAVLLMDILICSDLSNDEYNLAITNFQEKFPNEPNMNLMMIDGYFLQKEYGKMLDAINALDAQIDKDPILDFYRYLSYNLLKDDANAKMYLTKLLKNMPDFQRGYQELIVTELQNKNKAAADSLISIYRQKRKFNQEVLDDIISFY